MEKKRSLWPYLIAGFLAMVFLVNFTMLALAIKSDDGLTDADYYEKGLFYTSRMNAERELGWVVGFSFKEIPAAPSSNRVEVAITKNGEPVEGVSVRVILKRPATSRFDAEFALREAGASYGGEVVIPSGGLWEVNIVAEKNGRSMERVFRVKV